MAYFRPSQERAHVTKRFLTAREVEDMAAAGAVEIVQVDGLVITDAARETAHDLGLRIKQPQRQTEQDARSPARSPQPETSRRSDISAPAAPVGYVAPARIASVQSMPGASRSRGVVAADPILRTLVQAVRSNRQKLAALAQGD